MHIYPGLDRDFFVNFPLPMLPSVAILNPLSQLGGSEISLLELLKRSKGHFRFHLILPEDGPLREKAEREEIKVWVLPWPAKLSNLGERNKRISIVHIFQACLSTYPLIKKLSDLLGEIDCRILITNGIKCHIIGALLPKKKFCSVIWYLREGLEGRRLSGFLLKTLAPRCSAAIAISRYVAKESNKLFRKKLTVHVLYNIVDFKRFRPNVSHPLDLEKKDGEIWYGMVGAITPLKGQDLFIKAAAQVVKYLSNARFIIVGTNFYKTEKSDGYEAELHNLIKTLKLNYHVTFLGFRNDIPAVLSTLDVLVQPNRGPEGLGRAILEAMACGVPVIAANGWGPAEIIQHTKTGILFPPRDVETLSRRMIELGKHDELREEIVHHADKWIHKNISPEKIIDNFSLFIRDISRIKLEK